MHLLSVLNTNLGLLPAQIVFAAVALASGSRVTPAWISQQPAVGPDESGAAPPETPTLLAKVGHVPAPIQRMCQEHIRMRHCLAFMASTQEGNQV
jgi:hypothetical protein